MIIINYKHHVIDCKFSKIKSLLEATISSILQTHHIAITNLLTNVDFSPVLSSLLSRGVDFPPSGGVHCTDIPNNIFSMTTLYKNIICLGVVSVIFLAFLMASHKTLMSSQKTLISGIFLMSSQKTLMSSQVKTLIKRIN